MNKLNLGKRYIKKSEVTKQANASRQINCFNL